MKKTTESIINQFIDRYPMLEQCNIENAIEAIIEAYQNHKKILVCGNGGSASDALHIVGELMKGFALPRKLDQAKQDKLKELFPETSEYLINKLQMPLPAISLVSETALTTAFANDQAADLSFAQQVLGLGNEGDILFAISTSGNSINVIYAAQIAKLQGVKIIAMTGEGGGKLAQYADVLITVPSKITYQIQEYHLPVYHAICLAVENEFFREEA